MDEVGEFLDEIIPLQRDVVVALQNGDPGPRKALWSHEDPVTLFGAEASASGWEQVEPIFDRLAEVSPMVGPVRTKQGEWKVVHRHGDPFDAATREVLSRRREQGAM
jgi:hypothetical protein